MTDLQIIKEIENELDVKLEKVDELKWNTKGYILKNRNKIIGLSLYEYKINNLNRVFEDLKNLKNLITLSLGSNVITDISFLKDLKNLTTLDLSYNQITDYSFFKYLKNLTTIDLSFSQITDYSFFKNFKNLTTLDLKSNQITDISFLKDLKNITTLDLSYNQITDISFLKDLKNLTTLDLRSNQITELPYWITEFSMDITLDQYGNGLNLYNNPIDNPPLEIRKQGKDTIRNYFESTKIDNKELKIILLGNTTAGKTSLVEYITKKIYPPEKTTHGIKLTTWQPENEYDFLASIWDFGGQEYYHATHRLFLTNNAFYLLLWDKNKNETAILDTEIYTQKGILENKKLHHFHYEYWLKLIRNKFAPKAEIITVQNKTDISGNEIISQQIVDEYKIKEQYQISIEEAANGKKKHKRDYSAFEEDLKDYITDFIKSKAPEGQEAGKIQRYIYNIRNEIRNSWKDNYLTLEGFNQKATEVAKIGGDSNTFSLEITLKYLHDTGVLLYSGYEKNINKLHQS